MIGNSKKSKLINMLPGSKIELVDGRVGVFLRLKRSSFVISIDGATFALPIACFYKEVS